MRSYAAFRLVAHRFDIDLDFQIEAVGFGRNYQIEVVVLFHGVHGERSDAEAGAGHGFFFGHGQRLLMFVFDVGVLTPEARERVRHVAVRTRSGSTTSVAFGFGYPSAGCFPAEPTCVSPKVTISLVGSALASGWW